MGPSRSQKSKTPQSTLPLESPSQPITPVFLICVHTSAGFWQPDWCTAVPPTVSSCLFAAATLDVLVLLSLLSTPDHPTAALTAAPYLPWSPLVPSGCATVHVVSLSTCLWHVMVCFPGVLGFCPPWILKEDSSQL